MKGKELFDKVRINRIRVESCKCHKFDIENYEVASLTPIKCLNCKGDLHPQHAFEYILGYMAAGGNANDVWPYFFKDDEPFLVRCPKCFGKGFVEVNKDDFFDCDVCDGAGFVLPETAREFFENEESK